MQHRTLEEYKEEVFDKLDEQTKLEWLYEMSEKLCTIEEYIKDRLEEGCLDKLNYYDLHKIESILQGEDKE